MHQQLDYSSRHTPEKITFTVYATQKEYIEDNVADAYEASTSETILQKVTTNPDLISALRNPDTQYVIVSQNIDSVLKYMNMAKDKALILDNDFLMIYLDMVKLGIKLFQIQQQNKNDKRKQHFRYFLFVSICRSIEGSLIF